MTFISLGYDAQKLRSPEDYSFKNIMLAKVCDPVRLELEFSLKPLLKYTQESHLQTAYLLNKYIWSHDTEIIQAFGAKSMSVGWSHPEIEQIKADVEVSFGIDTKRTAFVNVYYEFLPFKGNNIVSSTLQELLAIANKISNVVEKLISSVEGEWQKKIKEDTP
jgi:hypothetical protein